MKIKSNKIKIIVFIIIVLNSGNIFAQSACDSLNNLINIYNTKLDSINYAILGKRVEIPSLERGINKQKKIVDSLNVVVDNLLQNGWNVKWEEQTTNNTKLFETSIGDISIMIKDIGSDSILINCSENINYIKIYDDEGNLVQQENEISAKAFVFTLKRLIFIPRKEYVMNVYLDSIGTIQNKFILEI